VRTYEGLIITPIAGAAGTKDESANFESLVKKHGGNVLSRNDLGKRFLGYTVKKTKEAYVTGYDFELSPEKVEPLFKDLRLSENVLKFMITLKSLEKKPRLKRKNKLSSPVEAKG